MAKWIFAAVCLAAACTLTHCQNNEGSLDDLINDLFTKSPNDGPGGVIPATPSSNFDNGQVATLSPLPSVIQNCDGGECVPYYLCTTNGTVNTNGEGLLDIRIDVQDEPRACANYIETCCATGDQRQEPQIPPVVIQPGCGNRNIEGIGFRISGDKDNEAQYGEFPWMVAVLREEQSLDQVLNVYQCGGSLIHPQVVLTAAHCVAGKEANKLKIRAGEWDTQTKNEIWPHQDRQVHSFVIHEEYYKGALYNDVALLFLESPVELKENVQTVCLPPQGATFDRTRCFASGWGKDVFGKEGKYQVILKKIDLPIVPHDQCEASLRTTRLGKFFQLHNSFVCAGGEPGKDTCKGDGGSPLVCPIPGTNHKYYQTGIVAWGIGCGENQVPGVYVNVAMFRNWIDAKLQSQRLDGLSYVYA